MMEVMENNSDESPAEEDAASWGSVTVMDRGDAPAQVVIEKNLKARSERRVEETKEQLEKITSRVAQAMAAFELDEKLMNDNKAAFFVPDLIELEKIIKDTIQKRKYQQEVTIFIVGYESKSGQRLKLLSQINDFFTAYINTIEEEEFLHKPANENELEEISSRVQEALDTASSAAQKLNDIGHDMFNIVEKLHGGKAASKSKKKLEKALMQAKDDIMNLTEKLMGAQTEIEEKEDQMTKLYKQIDVKNLEVMKYKNNAEMAKKNLGQVDDLKLLMKDKEEEIEKIQRAMADRELSVQQMEQSREATVVKLRAANEDNERKQQTIDKLQSKITTLQVQLDESRNDLQRHHESTIVSLKHQHNAELEAVKGEYQEKIDKLEEDLQNRVKHWAPESDDESEKPSISRKSSQLDLASRKSNRPELENKMSQTEGLELPAPPRAVSSLSDMESISVPPSRQPSNVQKKVDSLSRQSSTTATPALETPKPAPKQTPDTPKTQKADTPKTSKPNAPKVSALSTDSTDSASNVATPKRGARNKSNLEPVHEVPFEEKIPIEDEARWEKVPQEKLPSAFKQYRKEALFVVQGLQNEVKTVKEESHKKVTLLKTQAKENEDRWETEKHLLVQKVELVEKQKTEAEKEADEAMAQLENFVKEQGQMAKIKEEENKEKKLKKLTPEQRLKYFGPEKSILPDDVKETSKGPTQNGTSVDTSNQEQQQQPIEEREGPHNEAPPTMEGLASEAIDHEMQTTPVVQVGRSQQTSRLESRGHQELFNRLMATGRLTNQQKVEEPPAYIDTDSNVEEQKSLVDITTQTDPWVPTPKPPSYTKSFPRRNQVISHNEEEDKGEKDQLPNPRPLSRESDFDADVESDAFSERSLANHLSRVLADLTLSDEGGEDEDRPLSSTSQRSLYEKYRAQLEQKKAEIVERRSRATSMHGSLLSAKSERQGIRPRSNLTTPNGDIPFPDEVEKMDTATSPVAFSVSSKTSKQSVESIAEHPVVQDYLRAYQIVMDFKDSLITALRDKDLLSAAERLADIGQLTFNRNLNVQNQVYEMTTNIMSFLKEAASIINSYLYNDMEPAVSSLITTQADTSKTTSLRKEEREDKQTIEAESTVEMTAVTDPDVRELRENYENLKFSLDQQKKDYEDKLNNNAVMMMELQDTIQELQHELSAFGGSPSKPFSAVSGMSARFDPNTEPTIIFSRTDSERNQKALKRAVNARKLEPQRYMEVVQTMDQYTVLPAKRFVHLAKKYTHHMHMKQIEENVRQSNSLDEEVYALLERMEALQSLRAQRWGDQMDNLASERLHLAQMLMEALRKVEEESGIFMIKPILSWKGRNQIPHYQQSRISENYRPKPFLKPITPLRDGTPLNMVPAPTPASQHPVKSALMRPSTQDATATDGQTAPDQANEVPIKGSSVHLVGPQSQPMWAMSTSFAPPSGAGDPAKDQFSMVTTPRILELDVNRMLIGQNTVSALTKPFPPSNDRLVNASNASVRSYMSIDRPSAHPGQVTQQGRPNSTGTEGSRASPAILAVKTPNSAGSRHSRALSESALSLNQPLPPIKLPPNNTPEDGFRGRSSNGSSRSGTTGSSGSVLRKDMSRPVTHPSPPRTPPGSSLRQSPPLMNTVEPDATEDNEDVTSLGHVTKISMRSVSRSSERSFTPDKET
ncbi:myosin heavy chain, muscle-like isoform X3 [Acanthaster planci]|uniref:Myosin heavy chain, muscle-like isoform X3 n=1 Tax=Acanthaster planci TaxID=133434 RepID=A0A8B7XLT8_ACAPL|nr:myosin heavy chain, muscle-like isoform X3 [Acanthaster planci]